MQLGGEDRALVNGDEAMRAGSRKAHLEDLSGAGASVEYGSAPPGTVRVDEITDLHAKLGLGQSAHRELALERAIAWLA